jgi:hypothetical protein
VLRASTGPAVSPITAAAAAVTRPARLKREELSLVHPPFTCTLLDDKLPSSRATAFG